MSECLLKLFHFHIILPQDEFLAVPLMWGRSEKWWQIRAPSWKGGWDVSDFWTESWRVFRGNCSVQNDGAVFKSPHNLGAF